MNVSFVIVYTNGNRRHIHLCYKAEGRGLVSTPSYAGMTKKTLYKRGWILLCVGMFVGIVVTTGILALTLGTSDNQSVACPEDLGRIDNPAGITLYIAASCGKNFVVIPANIVDVSLEQTAQKVVDIVGTGTWEVIGERINFDMGERPDVAVWLDALNQTT